MSNRVRQQQCREPSAPSDSLLQLCPAARDQRLLVRTVSLRCRSRPCADRMQVEVEVERWQRADFGSPSEPGARGPRA